MDDGLFGIFFVVCLVVGIYTTYMRFKNFNERSNFNRLSKQYNNLVKQTFRDLSDNNVIQLTNFIYDLDINFIRNISNQLKSMFIELNASPDLSYEVKESLRKVLATNGVMLGNVKVVRRVHDQSNENQVNRSEPSNSSLLADLKNVKQHLITAKKLVEIDAEASFMKCRKFAEGLAQIVVRENGIVTEQLSLFDLLTVISTHNLLNQDLVDRLHFIRKDANNSVHLTLSDENANNTSETEIGHFLNECDEIYLEVLEVFVN